MVVFFFVSTTFVGKIFDALISEHAEPKPRGICILSKLRTLGVYKIMQDQDPSTTTLALLNLQAFGPLVYAVPSLIVYIVLIALLLGQFEEPFYRLFAINGTLVGHVMVHILAKLF